MRNAQLQPLALLLLSGNTLAQLCQSSSLTTGVNPEVTDFAAFEEQVAPFTATATGVNIPVYTNTVDLGATIVTAVGYAKSDALESAGYTVTSAWVTSQAPCSAVTTPAPTETGVLPPKPSGNCQAHGDHWHCDEEDHDDHDTPTTTTTSAASTVTPSTPSPTNGKNCEAHGDHWHCDEEDDNHDDHDDHDHDDEESGTKTTATPSTPSPTNGKNCEAHGDHWHCDDDEDDHSSSSTTAPSSTTVTPSTPSPTDGVNCKAHGDHWHCDNDDDEDDHSTGNNTTKGNTTTTPAPINENDSAAGGLKISTTLVGVVGAALAVWML